MEAPPEGADCGESRFEGDEVSLPSSARLEPVLEGALKPPLLPKEL